MWRPETGRDDVPAGRRRSSLESSNQKSRLFVTLVSQCICLHIRGIGVTGAAPWTWIIFTSVGPTCPVCARRPHRPAPPFNLHSNHIGPGCNFPRRDPRSILLSSDDIWGPASLSDPPPHDTQDRAETVIPAPANDSREEARGGRKPSPVISVFKRVPVIVLVYCSVALRSLWTTVIKMTGRRF